jgi:hypothetical protein
MTSKKIKLILITLIVFVSGCSLPFSPPKSIEKQLLSPEQIQDQFNLVKSNIQKKPEWLFPIEICPLDIMPDYETDSNYSVETCDINPLACYENCKNGNGNACYGLAVALQNNLGIEQVEAEALHLKACKLGITSGCTNRAAAKFNLEANNSEAIKCSVSTFEKTCEKNDPWGCTMFGFALAHGKGIEQDLDKSLSVLSKSCKYGLEDEACQNAKDLESQIIEFRNIRRKKTISKSKK